MAFFDRDHVRKERTWIFPPFFPLAAVLTAWILDGRVAAAAMTPSLFLRIVGTFWLSIGAGLMAWAIVHQYRRGTDPNPYADTTALVTDGPYRFTRNPIYLADLCIQAGLSLLLAWEWGLLLLPVTWAGLRFLVIRNEEHYLPAVFGDAYEDYRRRVRRWF